MKPHVRRYQAVSEAVSSVRQLRDDRLQMFAVLKTAHQDDELGWLTAGQVADILCEAEGQNVSRQRVTAVLSAERQAVARRRIEERDRFRLMHAGEVELAGSLPSAADSIFVDPEKGLSAIRKFEETLGALKGSLKICDPHIENKTLDFLSECTAAKSIGLLTVNIHKDTAFRRDLAAFRAEHRIPIDVRLSANAKLHDRYIVHDDGLLMLGGSLNGFAKKQSFVVALGPDMRSLTEVSFDAQWAAAKPFT